MAGSDGMDRRTLLRLGAVAGVAAATPLGAGEAQAAGSACPQTRPLVEEIVHGSTVRLGNNDVRAGGLRVQGRYDLGTASEKVGAELVVLQEAADAALAIGYSEEARHSGIAQVPARALTTSLETHCVTSDPEWRRAGAIWTRHEDYGLTHLVSDPNDPDVIRMLWSEGRTVKGAIRQFPVDNVAYNAREQLVGNPAQLGLGKRHSTSTYDPRLRQDYDRWLAPTLGADAGDHPITTVRRLPNEELMARSGELPLSPQQRERMFREGHRVEELVTYRTAAQGGKPGMGAATPVLTAWLDLDHNTDQALLIANPAKTPSGAPYAKVWLGGIDTSTGLVERKYGVDNAGTRESVIYKPEIADIAAGVHDRLAPRIGRFHGPAPAYA